MSKQQSGQGSDNVILAGQEVTNPLSVFKEDISINDDILSIESALYLKNEFEVSGLSLGTYVFSVRTESIRGLLSNRAESIANDISVPTVTNLTFTRNLTRNVALGAGKLSWDAPVNFRAKQYIVEYTINNEKFDLGKIQSNSIVVKGLDAGIYNFSVKVESFTGDTSEASVLNNVTIKTNGVTELQFLPDIDDLDNNSVGKLTWNAPINNKINLNLI